MGEVIITDKVFPEWKLTSQFINQHLSRALSLDAKLSSHPIEVECPDANRINQVRIYPSPCSNKSSQRSRSSMLCLTRKLLRVRMNIGSTYAC